MKIYVCKISDKRNDTSWTWAFLNLPSPSDISGSVAKFLNMWRDDPTVFQFYSSWHEAPFHRLQPFSGTAAMQGVPLGNDIYIKLNRVDFVENP